jgi:hypothetical protein
MAKAGIGAKVVLHDKFSQRMKYISTSRSRQRFQTFGVNIFTQWAHGLLLFSLPRIPRLRVPRAAVERAARSG